MYVRELTPLSNGHLHEYSLGNGFEHNLLNQQEFQASKDLL